MTIYERRDKVVDVWYCNSGADEKYFHEFVANLNKSLEKVPLEYRDKIIMHDIDDYYSGWCGISATYTRPETDEEMAARIAQSEEYEQQRKIEQHAEYLRLKRIFND